MPDYEDPITKHVQKYLEFGGRQDDLLSAQTEPIIFVHGGCFSGGNPGFAKIIARELATATGKRVVVPNHRTDTLSNAVYDIVALYKHLFDGEKVVLCGGSSGGYLALAAAAQKDLLVHKMVLFCPVANPEARLNYLYECAAPMFGGEPLGSKHKPPGRAAQMIKDQNAFDFDLDNIPNNPPVETLVIAGGQDLNVPLDTLTKLLSQPSVQGHIVGSGTHDLQTHLSPATESAVVQFMNK